MQCIDFRKIAYLYGVIARKRTMTYIKKRFLAPFRETEIWKISRRPMEKINRSQCFVYAHGVVHDVCYSVYKSMGLCFLYSFCKAFPDARFQ